MANKGVLIDFELGGREGRCLRFGTNAICDFEQVTGVTVQQLGYRTGVYVTRGLLWAGLKHEEDGLTLIKVGEWLDDFNEAVGGEREAGERLSKKIHEALVLAGIFSPPQEEAEGAEDDEGAELGEAVAKA